MEVEVVEVAFSFGKAVSCDEFEGVSSAVIGCEDTYTFSHENGSAMCMIRSHGATVAWQGTRTMIYLGCHCFVAPLMVASLCALLDEISCCLCRLSRHHHGVHHTGLPLIVHSYYRQDGDSSGVM